VVFITSSAAGSIGIIDFTAANPLTYDHGSIATEEGGGGAYNYRTIGLRNLITDVVESLAPADFECGDFVTHFLRVNGESGWNNETINVTFIFTSSTGQPGATYTAIPNIASDPAFGDQDNHLRINRPIPTVGHGKCFNNGISSDCGHADNHQVAQIVYSSVTQTQVGIQFSRGSYVEISFLVTGIDDTDLIVIRIDVPVICSGASATGVLQGRVSSVSFENGTPINVGTQTIPLKAPVGPPETVYPTLTPEPTPIVPEPTPIVPEPTPIVPEPTPIVPEPTLVPKETITGTVPPV